MGLTFQQSFYQAPEEVYLVQFLEPGDFASTQAVYAILEIPEDKDRDSDLNLLLESNGYCTQRCDIDRCILDGYDLLKELGVKDRRKDFGIY